MAKVYGIGNPLIDYLCDIEDEDIKNLGLDKGTMLLIGEEKQREIIEYTKGKDIKFSPGGSCPNTMVTLRSLGIECTLQGGVGNDELGKTYRRRLKECGVNDKCVTKDALTGTSIILLTKDKERTMNTYLGANRLFSPEDVDIKSAEEADLFYFTGYMWDTECQQNAVRKVLDIFKEKNGIIAFDLADPFAVGRYRQTFLNLLENYCDIVFANSEEARFLFDNYDAYECCRSMGKLCPISIVKNGKKGSFISDHKTIYEIPLYGTNKPVDTTGAGDTYAAGFLYGYLNNYPTEISGRIASYLSGEIVTQFGSQFPPERIPALKAFIDNSIAKDH